VPQAARAAIEAARPYAADPDPLEEVHRILTDGGGADRQRAAFTRGGMPAVLGQLVEETALATSD
jgi:carboxylate-amine ligase